METAVAATQRPVIVQSDFSILLETAAPGAEAARDDLLTFAELVKSPEHVHTYRITPLSLWNAASAGHGVPWIQDALARHSRFPVPENVRAVVREQGSRYGRLTLHARAGGLVLTASDDALAEEVWRHEKVKSFLVARPSAREIVVRPDLRGHLKQALVKLGWPVEDLAGYAQGAPLALSLRERTLRGEPFSLRPYQEEAARIFYDQGSERGGTGTIVLPCGSGKTVVGLAAIVAAGTRTLVLTTGTQAARQWRDEILDKTTLVEEDVLLLTGETTAARKKAGERGLGRVTVSTYQLLTHKQGERFPHMEAVQQADLGLVVYDEVHLLPAPVFRLTAELQARRRIGLTATLVREDGREDDVFSLVGPKRYDVPWKVLERAGWIAEAVCTEVRVPLHPSRSMEYATAPNTLRARVAAENPAKLPVLERLLARHAHEPVLVLGTYVEQIEAAGALADAPVITGKTPERKREELYRAFRQGEIRLLVLSKVGNYAIDLPEASVAVQISGNFGSRQEEAQRLGRILRPKKGGGTARFYSLVTRETVEQDFAMKRQLFLTEQGYRYEIQDVALGGGDA
jgi:DNA excision repair protein ERCC-3